MKNVFYLGPNGSYSNIITVKALEVNVYHFLPCDNFLQIVNHTRQTPQSLGVLPIENSITSDIHENIDSIFNHDLLILHEAYLRINLHVIGFPNTLIDDITAIYSHPRALAQCSRFIEKHLVTLHEVPSTSAAKEILLHNKIKNEAIIGSKELVTDGKLQILEKNIGNDPFNMTRFVFLGKNPEYFSQYKKNKATIIFKVPHTSGSLAKILNSIASIQVNLTKIESRPIPGTNWEYQFWIDIENEDHDLDMQKINDILMKHTLSYKVLGIYQRGNIFIS